MKFTRLGPTGLSVSRLCLGFLSHGDPTKGWHGDWLPGEEDSRPFFRAALEAGIKQAQRGTPHISPTSAKALRREVANGFAPKAASRTATRAGAAPMRTAANHPFPAMSQFDARA